MDEAMQRERQAGRDWVADMIVPYSKIPKDPLKFALHSLCGTDALVYLALAVHINGRTYACWPSVGTIMELTGLTRRSVQQGISGLTRCPHRGNLTPARVRTTMRRGAHHHAPIIEKREHKKIKQYECNLLGENCQIDPVDPATDLPHICSSCPYCASLIIREQKPGRSNSYKFRDRLSSAPEPVATAGQRAEGMKAMRQALKNLRQ